MKPYNILRLSCGSLVSLLLCILAFNQIRKRVRPVWCPAGTRRAHTTPCTSRPMISNPMKWINVLIFLEMMNSEAQWRSSFGFIIKLFCSVWKQLYRKLDNFLISAVFLFILFILAFFFTSAKNKWFLQTSFEQNIQFRIIFLEEAVLCVTIEFWKLNIFLCVWYYFPKGKWECQASCAPQILF